MDSKTHGQPICHGNPRWSVTEIRWLIVELGSKKDEKTKSRLWFYCPWRYLATDNISLIMNPICRSFFPVASGGVFGFGKRCEHGVLGKVADLMARVASFVLSRECAFHLSACGPETISLCRVTTHTLCRTQAIEIRTCRCSFDRSNGH